jgi:hypothetical protein
MIAQSKEFYDLLGQGLSGLGFVDNSETSALSQYIDTYFADKYNAEATMATAGFPLNQNVKLSDIYEQIEATTRPYTIATHTDIDADGPVKGHSGVTLSTGNIPIWKHKTVTGRKDVKDELRLAQRLGGADQQIIDSFMALFFDSVDELIGGNHNTMLYLRNMIVSTGKLVINAANNPAGIPMSIDFCGDYRTKHTTTSTWYTKDSSTGKVTQDSAVGATGDMGIDPIALMRSIRTSAQLGSDHLPLACHWECDFLTWEAILAMPWFRQFYTIATRPDITDVTNQTIYGRTIDDDTFKAWFEKLIGSKVVVNDNLASIEKINTTTHKTEFVDLRGFEEGTFVLVPDGDLGDSQFAAPFAIGSNATRIAYFDGNRTMIRTVFDDEHMTYANKSEFTGLPVPNKTRWQYFLKIKG